jgi:DNA-binding MarR family transcriptional regulator
MSNGIDDTIHQKTRLAVIAHLVATGESDFVTLRKTLGLTDGNLSIHSAILEEKGLIEVEKSFVGRRPRTVYRVTAKGWTAFNDYLEELERVLKGGG